MIGQDPFRHCPDLRSKIVDPEVSYFRNLNEKFLEDLTREQDLPGGWWYSDDVREAMRKETLASRWGEDLWVFGYGSLMWDPGIRFDEVRRARISGYSRRFILVEDRGGRGTVERPGLVAALDEGPGCEGLAFRIRASEMDEESSILWQREQIAPGYVPAFIPAFFGSDEVTALTFVADHNVDRIIPDLSFDKQVTYLATGAGVLGTSADYLRKTVQKFHELGIEDAETEALLIEVERRCRDGQD